MLQTRRAMLHWALACVLFVLALLSFAGPAPAAGLAGAQAPPPDLLERANAFAARIGQISYDFFVETNKAGDVLRLGDLVLPHEGTVKYLVWGPWHSDPGWDGEGTTKKDRSGFDRARYIGYGYYGERVSNVFFPPDRPGGWRPLDGAGFIEWPWQNNTVKEVFPQFFGSVSRFDNRTDPLLIDSMQWGLWYCAFGNDFGPPDKNSDLYQNPQKYVHVFLPPSEETWGMGVMFCRDPDGIMWYKSVPLPYARQWPDPDDAISLEPQERAGNPGDKVTFTLSANWNDLDAVRLLALYYGFDFGLLVTVSHVVDGVSYPAQFTLDGAQSMDSPGDGWAYIKYDDFDKLKKAEKTGTVTVTVQGRPSEVVARLVPYLYNGSYGETYYWTDVYLFKEARAKVKPNLPNLKVTSISLNPNPGQEGSLTKGVITVVNESQQSFTQVPTKWVARRPDGSTLAEGVIRADYGPGEAKQLEISFVPDTGGNHRVAAMVNPDGNNPPNEVNFLNGDWPGDNRKEAAYQVAWKGVDVWVRISDKTPASVVEDYGDSIFVVYEVGRDASGPPEVNVTVSLTAGGSGSETVVLGPGKSGEGLFEAPMKPPGSYWFEVQAWPVGVNDTNPANNVDSTTVAVEAMPSGPELPPDISETRDVLVNPVTDKSGW